MTITIDFTNRIFIDHVLTGLSLDQRREQTVIYTPESAETKYEEHTMPHKRYSTVHDTPLSNSVGRAQLEIDVRSLIENTLSKRLIA